MNFKSFLVEASKRPSPQIVASFVNIAKKYFGDADSFDSEYNASGQFRLDGEFERLNRMIDATLEMQGQQPVVILNFDWLNHDNVQDTGFSSKMAPGSKELITRLKNLAQELGRNGFSISYHAQGQAGDSGQRRADLYRKGLEKSGFSKVDVPGMVQKWSPISASGNPGTL